MKKIINELPYDFKNIIFDYDIQIFQRNINYNWMIYNEIICIDEKMDIFSKIWTIWHEIWHFMDNTPKNEIAPYLTRYKQEKQADSFAFENLIPEKELKEQIEVYCRSIEELKSIFKVPIKILKQRILQIYWKNNPNIDYFWLNSF